MARAWRDADPDPVTALELDTLVEATERGDHGAAQDLAERFSGRLRFGTAGLRGRLGAGPMRMNRAVVRHTAAGLMRTLAPGATVVVGYDARHCSADFALDTAGVVVASGATALLLPRALPTPVLAFAVRHLGADAGVMVTASHNPPADNGYKVYLGDGIQVVPSVAAAIEAATEVVAAGPPVTVARRGWRVLGDEVIAAYLDVALSVAPRAGRRELRIVYTAMHGVGRDLVVALLGRAGFDDVSVVAAQAEPDPDFPTVAFPNPEEPGALDLALAEAKRLGADLVLANDPDADRLGAAVPEGDGWRVLTGNEIGALLAEHLLGATRGGERLLVTTVVSSRLLSAQAAAAGVHYAETLTGFKWIMRAALDRPDSRFLFGYEEALGFAVTDAIRDKDGITAALAVADLAARARAAGSSLLERLDDIARRHGLHATAQVTIAGFGVVHRLRARLPSELAGRAVESVRDLLDGADLPPTDGLVFALAGGARVVVRPSGTEPKTKAYLEVVLRVGDDVGVTRAAAARELDELATALRELVATA